MQPRKIVRLPSALFFAAALGAPAQAQPVDEEKLGAIDRGFVCPEDPPDVRAKENALEQFASELTAAWPGVTIEQSTRFRRALLERRGCAKTLERSGAMLKTRAARSAV
jgi:hypothetical protein